MFDYCFDLENELKWNPDGLLSLEAITPPPIVVGTKFLAIWKGSPPMTCEYICIERPVDWEVYASAKGMDVAFRGEVTNQGSGARLTVTMTLIPRSFLRLLSPFLKRSFQRGELKNLASIKAHMEGTSSPSIRQGDSMLSISLIRRIVDQAFNRGNLTVVNDVLAPDYHAHITNGGAPHGPEGLKITIATFRPAFPDLHGTVEAEIHEGIDFLRAGSCTVSTRGHLWEIHQLVSESVFKV